MPTDAFYTFAHPTQSIMTIGKDVLPTPVRIDLTELWRQPDTIIMDTHEKFFFMATDTQFNVAGMSMFFDIRERFQTHLPERLLDRLRQALDIRLQSIRNVQTSALRQFARGAAEGMIDMFMLQCGRTQVGNRSTQGAHTLARNLFGRLQLALAALR